MTFALAHFAVVFAAADPGSAAVVPRSAESLDTGLDLFILSVLLTLLAAVTLAIVRNRNMFGVVILFGVYSFVMASVMMTLDAVDVAMTEAAVGAGISTVIMLATLHLTGSMEYPQPRNIGLPLFVALVVGGALVYGTFFLPAFGLAETPIHLHTAPR
ncbi:MAG: hydrogenase subunit MbhD domain-containing protein, partial [Pseudomonadota bacterium]